MGDDEEERDDDLCPYSGQGRTLSQATANIVTVLRYARGRLKEAATKPEEQGDDEENAFYDSSFVSAASQHIKLGQFIQCLNQANVAMHSACATGIAACA